MLNSDSYLVIHLQSDFDKCFIILGQFDEMLKHLCLIFYFKLKFSGIKERGSAPKASIEEA